MKKTVLYDFVAKCNRTYSTRLLEKKRNFYNEVAENYKSISGNMNATNFVTFEMFLFMEEQDMLDDVQRDLDRYCSNGYTSRWTSFGEDLFSDCEAMIKELKSTAFFRV